jgi:hypothetical protein
MNARIRRGSAVLLAPVLLVSLLVSWAPGRAGAATGTPLLGKQVIGFSVKHRPIVAYHLGDPRRRPVLIIGQMHGDEPAGVKLANSIVHGTTAVEGINLWVVPTMNPDGFAAHRRQNAHKVDLNRNWPDRWARLSGMYYSGPHPRSEPETRAVQAFLLRLRPRYVVVLHQPLYGVDTTDGGALDKAFRNRLARNLGLPRKPFRCWSTCHGSLTGWYTTHRYGIAITVEFGSSPRTSYLTGKARRGVVSALGGHFGSLAAHDPRGAVTGAAKHGTVHLSGFAFDVDARGTSLRYVATRDGRTVAHGTANRPSRAVNARYVLTGAHGLALDAPATPGRHRFCLTFTNLGAGRGNATRCVSVDVPTPTPTPAPTDSAPGVPSGP